MDTSSKNGIRRVKPTGGKNKMSEFKYIGKGITQKDLVHIETKIALEKVYQLKRRNDIETGKLKVMIEIRNSPLFKLKKK